MEESQPFAALVLRALVDRSERLGQQWAERAQLATLHISGFAGDPKSAASPENAAGAKQLITALLAAAMYGARKQRSLTMLGMVLGIEAHRRSMPLHLMLKELDLLSRVLLHGAVEVVRQRASQGTAYEGLQVGHHIAEAVSQLQLAAVIGYTEAVSDELRERYRAIRHDLRNPLGTIKTAVALLTDETVPAELRESGRVRAMVARNTRSLDQLIDKALSDTAAKLNAFEAPPELSETFHEQSPSSAREKRDDVPSPSERSDLESGTL